MSTSFRPNTYIVLVLSFVELEKYYLQFVLLQQRQWKIGISTSSWWACPTLSNSDTLLDTVSKVKHILCTCSRNRLHQCHQSKMNICGSLCPIYIWKLCVCIYYLKIWCWISCFVSMKEWAQPFAERDWKLLEVHYWYNKASKFVNLEVGDFNLWWFASI